MSRTRIACLDACVVDVVGLHHHLHIAVVAEGDVLIHRDHFGNVTAQIQAHHHAVATLLRQSKVG